MSECICNSCKNLKGILDENGVVGSFECEYGFPSEICDVCEEEACDLSCEHYRVEDEQLEFRTVHCATCGKEMQKVCSEAEPGDVFCIDCYLKKI